MLTDSEKKRELLTRRERKLSPSRRPKPLLPLLPRLPPEPSRRENARLERSSVPTLLRSLELPLRIVPSTPESSRVLLN